MRSDLRRRRRVRGHSTPLLVPSFSSRGFDIRRMFPVLAPHLSESCLVSAYDMHHGLLPHSAINEANLVFLDSGGYEILPPADALDPGYEASPALSWDEESHLSLLKRLEPHVDVVATTPDLYATVAEQISRAAKFQTAFPAFGASLLMKPTAPGQTLDIDNVVQSVPSLPDVDVLGFVDKDLGMTPLARCRSLVRVRKALDELGNQIPIHVYGCLDPPSVLAFHACGADIFDGLSWLRFAWSKGKLEYHGTGALRRGAVESSDMAVAYDHHVANLSELLRLQDLVARGTAAAHPDFADYAPALEDLIARAYEAA